MLALVGHAKPCGCILRVHLFTPGDPEWKTDWCRQSMREQGLRPKAVDSATLTAPVTCQHAQRKARR